MTSQQLKAELLSIFSEDQLIFEPQEVKNYAVDWSKHLEIKSCGVVFPKSTAQVQQLVRFGRLHQLALIPSGGRTGLSGAAAATKGELVVSFEKMNRILGFDEYDQTITVEPGVITEVLQQEAERKGLLFPIDFAARGSSQIGGNIATNAGGINVLKYGLTRQWIAHLEVVTGSGEILNLNQSLIKNATGYDLRQLFIGSEGTLGFVTKATIKLAVPPTSRAVLLLAVNDVKHILTVFKSFSSKTDLLAFEMFTIDALELVLAHQRELKSPFASASPYYLIVEIDAPAGGPLDQAMSVFEELLEKEMIQDGILSQSPQQSRQLWRLREEISEATSHYSPYKNDVSVRISKVTDFLTETQELLNSSYPQFRVIWFGHIGDGNLHINILKPDDLSIPAFVSACEKVNHLLFDMIRKFQGSVSAEHGVGLLKKPYLHMTRSHEEIQLMKQIKKVFDPDGIMNPGKIFDI